MTGPPAWTQAGPSQSTGCSFTHSPGRQVPCFLHDAMYVHARPHSARGTHVCIPVHVHSCVHTSVYTRVRAHKPVHTFWHYPHT